MTLDDPEYGVRLARDSLMPLPTVTLRPTADTGYDKLSDWIGRSQVHSDDDGESYLVLRCQHMEVSIAFGEDAGEMERIATMLLERVKEIKGA